MKQNGLLNKRVFRYFKKTYKSLIETKSIQLRKRVIKKIAIIIDEDNDNIAGLLKAIRLLSEDYSFKFYNQALSYVFEDEDLIIFTDIKKFNQSEKMNNNPIIALLLHEDAAIIKKGYKLDLVLCKSFYQVDALKKHYNTIHAFGIDYIMSDTNIEEKNIDASGILKKRYAGLKEINSNDYNSEFLISPLWDIKYFSEQLRKAFNLFQTDTTRKINPIFSNRFLKVGRHSFHNGYEINGNVFVNIGSFCSIGKNVSIYTVNHDTRFPTTQGYLYRKYFLKPHPAEMDVNLSKSRSKGPITIKNDVIIYEGAKIMSGVVIGNGACIGAGAIVTKDVDDYEIVAGMPAKHVSYRYSENIREQLLEINWWDWSDTKIARNETFFTTDLTTIESVFDLIN